MDAVLSVESTQLTHHTIDDELVETLQELSAKVLVQEMDETQAECLLPGS